jgi:hypothetical protein
METRLHIDVATLEAPQRRALEKVLGRHLAANQQLVISIIDVSPPQAAAPRPAQSLEDWTRVYDGLNDEEIEGFDKIARTRANLTRNLP